MGGVAPMEMSRQVEAAEHGGALAKRGGGRWPAGRQEAGRRRAGGERAGLSVEPSPPMYSPPT